MPLQPYKYDFKFKQFAARLAQNSTTNRYFWYYSTFYKYVKGYVLFQEKYNNVYSICMNSNISDSCCVIFGDPQRHSQHITTTVHYLALWTVLVHLFVAY